MPLQVVVKPPTHRRPRALAWGFSGIALFAGFLAGSALTGAETGLYTTAAIALLAIMLTIVTLALAAQVASRYGCSWMVPAALWLCAWVGGVLIGVGGRFAEDLRGAAQLEAWFGTGEALAGIALAAVGVLIAAALTMWSRAQPPPDEREGEER